MSPPSSDGAATGWTAISGHFVMIRTFPNIFLVRLLPSEGGDGGNGACYRHHDRRNIKFGICLRKR